MKFFEKTLLYVTALIVLSLIPVIWKEKRMKEKVVYIDIGKMVNDYRFKKMLSDEQTKNLYVIKKSADSLYMIKKIISDTRIDSLIAHTSRVFTDYYNSSNQEITKKVWDRLNPLLDKFGNERGYSIIIGANGGGTVLYGMNDLDVTSEVVEYINFEYDQNSVK